MNLDMALNFQRAYNRALARQVDFLMSYVPPTPASTFLVYHRLERWGA